MQFKFLSSHSLYVSLKWEMDSRRLEDWETNSIAAVNDVSQGRKCLRRIFHRYVPYTTVTTKVRVHSLQQLTYKESPNSVQQNVTVHIPVSLLHLRP